MADTKKENKVSKFFNNLKRSIGIGFSKAHQGYGAILFPLTPIKFFALAMTAGIFVVSADSWARTFNATLFQDSAIASFFTATTVFFSVQLLEILPLVMSHGHNTPEELAARISLASYDEFEKAYLRDQDILEEYRVPEQSLQAAMVIQALAFLVDLIVNWISWAPITGLDLFLSSGVFSAVSVDGFSTTMVILTVWGIPWILSLSLKEAQRSNYFITKTNYNAGRS